jgi:NitT/TauT family transport system substrate-binding protein
VTISCPIRRVQHGRRRHGAGEFHDQQRRRLRGKKNRDRGRPARQSWLLLQAWRAAQSPICAARPIVIWRAAASLQKAVQEHDATLTFWNFCADLEDKGFKRAIVMDEE